MRAFELNLYKGVTNLRETAEGERLEELAQAVNLDLTNERQGRLRKGRVQRLAVTAPHSLQVSPYNSQIAWFVTEGILKVLQPGYTAVDLVTLSTNTRLSYAFFNQEVVASNGAEIGWLSAAEFVPFAPTLGVFEAVMPAGQYLAFFKGSLLVARGSVLYVSKPYNAEIRDERFSEFPLDGYIRMLGTVEDGIWLATDNGVYFLGGAGAEEWTMQNRSDQVPADGCFGSGFVREKEEIRQLVYWAADGFYEGRAGGALENLSEGLVRLPKGITGECFRREADGMTQYIAVIHGAEDGNIPAAHSFEVHTLYS
jgi:hypothetical protein